jgi:hypothetical protein
MEAKNKTNVNRARVIDPPLPPSLCAFLKNNLVRQIYQAMLRRPKANVNWRSSPGRFHSWPENQNNQEKYPSQQKFLLAQAIALQD